MAQVDKKALGKRVAVRRTALGLSQATLAKAIGMKQQGVDNIEKGIVARPRMLIELSEALQTSPDWLLYAKGPEVVKTANPIEEIVTLAQAVSPEKLGAVIALLKQLADSDAAVA